MSRAQWPTHPWADVPRGTSARSWVFSGRIRDGELVFQVVRIVDGQSGIGA
jgi:hypothetical protein